MSHVKCGVELINTIVLDTTFTAGTRSSLVRTSIKGASDNCPGFLDKSRVEVDLGGIEESMSDSYLRDLMTQAIGRAMGFG